MNILHGALKGEIENKIGTLKNIVYNVNIQRFGVVEKNRPRATTNICESQKEDVDRKRPQNTVCAVEKTESQEEKDALDILRDGEHSKR